MLSAVEFELDSRTRLLRSQLQRQKVLEQVELDRRLARKEEQLKREDRFSTDVQPSYILPPVCIRSAMIPNTSRNTKSDEFELDSRSRLLRSQLRRQKVLEQMKLDRRYDRKEGQLKREDRFVTDEQPSYILPPVCVRSAMLPSTSRNTKSDLVDLMMKQSAHVTQMMSQRMALSLVTSEDRGQSHTKTARTNQSDKRLLSLILNAVKEKSAASDVQRHVDIRPYYLPVLPRLPVATSLETPKERKYVLEETASHPASMTSRWRARAPAKQDPPLGKTLLSSGMNSNIVHRRKALKRFRLAAYFAVFLSIMKAKSAKRLMYDLRKPVINDDVITGIRIKECVQALHKVYLDPERKIVRILRQIYDSNLDLSSVLSESSSKVERHKATETLASFIEHIAYEMTFVPTATGNLGTENRSNLYHLLQPQQSFPAHYFWGVEKDVLGIDAKNRTTEIIGTNEKFILLIGLCLGRALIATILRSPHQFGLTQSVKTEAQSTKIRLIVTIFLYLVRKLYAPPKGNPVAAAFPEDLSKKLFTDKTMKKLYKKLETSFGYAEKLLRDWGQNYIRKMRHT